MNPLEKLHDFVRGTTVDIEHLKAQLTTQTNRAAAAEQQVTALTQRLDMANRMNTDARNQLAQLSARQAAPDGWRLVPTQPTQAMCDAAKYTVHAGLSVFKWADGYYAMLSAAPPPPEREPQKHEENRELAETAMRFVDRAGDVHPGIDDADRICAEFHAAMMEVIEKWHPMPMPPGIGATNRAEGPIFIDRARMDRALAGPFFTLPEGLTPAEIVAHLRGTGGEG